MVVYEESLHVEVDTVAEVAALLAGDTVGGSVQGLRLSVRSWRAPWPHWVGRQPVVPGLTRQELRLPIGEGSAVLELHLAQPVAVADLLSAALGLLSPIRPLPAGVTPQVLVTPRRPGWLPVDPAYETGPESPESAGPVPRHDFALALDGPDGNTVVRVVGRDVPLVVVDAATANPRGRQETAVVVRSADLSIAGPDATWRLTRPGRPGEVLVTGRAGIPLDERQTAALAGVGGATLRDAPDSATTAGVLAQLAMTGLVLHTPRVPDGTRAYLDDDLLALVEAAPADLKADPMEHELRGVAQRRAALRGHAAAFVLRRAVAAAHSSASRLPTVTAVLVSRRPDRAVAAVAALAAQTYPALEVVVALHGVDATDDQHKQLAAHPVPVRVATFPAGQAFGDVLGAASGIGSGSLLTKVDDDDHYGPEHIWDLVLARHYSSATVVGKGAEFVHLETHDVTVRRRMGSELYTDVVAGGTMLLSRGDLEEVGGWRPLARSVDRGLLDRILAAGGLVYRTHGFGFLYTRHDEGHTWDAEVDYFLADPVRRWQGKPPYPEFGVR